ncbi:HET-domain-containing protein [Hypoxylon sp. FL1857]|nr:HET-domain-containing protein [Hypoxylon sp. FL1857]
MRLINIKSYEIEEFFGEDIPEYAILSHTWGKGEVSFQEWKDLNDSVRAKPGYRKIMGACQLARKGGFDWLWVDTICIDKSSSAELTEAINSMFAWYRDSKICYAYLEDVAFTDSWYPEPSLDSFKKSRWFTRGWTLQELLAPQKVYFYDRGWELIGAKEQALSGVRCLVFVIAGVTGIGHTFLDGSSTLNNASVAKRLSWIANRKTTRVEDMAYCLLGIFDINMPLLYGEGMKAFTRLQHEIIKSSSDHTIFSWTWDDNVPSNWVSMLAPFPSSFANSGKYFRKDAAARLKPYAMTNIGLSIELPVIYGSSHIFAILNILNAPSCIPRIPCQTWRLSTSS